MISLILSRCLCQFHCNLWSTKHQATKHSETGAAALLNELGELGDTSRQEGQWMMMLWPCSIFVWNGIGLATKEQNTMQERQSLSPEGQMAGSCSKEDTPSSWQAFGASAFRLVDCCCNMSAAQFWTKCTKHHTVWHGTHHCNWCNVITQRDQAPHERTSIGATIPFPRARPLQVFGEGTVTPGEECGDGNVEDGDCCSSNCKTEICGDGTVNNAGTEECDDGNVEDGMCTRSNPKLLVGITFCHFAICFGIAAPAWLGRVLHDRAARRRRITLKVGLLVLSKEVSMLAQLFVEYFRIMTMQFDLCLISAGTKDNTQRLENGELPVSFRAKNREGSSRNIQYVSFLSSLMLRCGSQAKSNHHDAHDGPDCRRC